MTTGRYLQPKRTAQLVAFGLAVVAAGLLALVPADGQTLVDANGRGVLVTLAVPVALTLVPLLLVGRAWVVGSIVCAALLAAAVVVGLLSIGVFFLPALIAAVVGAALSPRRSSPAPAPQPARA